MAPLDLTMTQLISKISELHNDITCQINLDPPADIVTPYQLGLHQQQLASTLATYKMFILHWNILAIDHADSIGQNDMQAWQQWKNDLDAKFKAFRLASSNKAEEINTNPTLQRQSDFNHNSLP